MTATPGTVHRVHGEFEVPTVTCFSGEYDSAIYLVYMDYSSPGLPENGAGILFGCSNGSPFYVFFVFQSGSPDSPAVTVYPGDHISAQVMLNSTGDVRWHIADLTRGHRGQASNEYFDLYATGTSFGWSLFLIESPQLPNFKSIHTFDDWADLSSRTHSIGYWSQNSAVSTSYTTMSQSGITMAHPTFIDDDATSFNIIWDAYGFACVPTHATPSTSAC